MGNSCKDIYTDLFNCSGLLIVKRKILCVLALIVIIFFDLIRVKTREGSQSCIQGGFNIIRGRFSWFNQKSSSIFIDKFSHAEAVYFHSEKFVLFVLIIRSIKKNSSKRSSQGLYT